MRINQNNLQGLGRGWNSWRTTRASAIPCTACISLLTVFLAARTSFAHTSPGLQTYSGIHDVWKWGASVGGQMWRTTSNIGDNYNRMLLIGFAQNGLEKYAGSGHWNDPDMLEIGNGGMKGNVLSEPPAPGCDLPAGGSGFRVSEFTWSRAW
jgi:hypothetical protein